MFIVFYVLIRVLYDRTPSDCIARRSALNDQGVPGHETKPSSPTGVSHFGGLPIQRPKTPPKVMILNISTTKTDKIRKKHPLNSWCCKTVSLLIHINPVNQTNESCNFQVRGCAFGCQGGCGCSISVECT